MKFLCDSCKAKYQISDDKVAGKTVRMKCRKCGHQIEVRAAVTETSVSVAPPKPDAAPAAPAPAAPKRAGLATSLSAARPQTQKMSRPEPSGALAGAFTKSVKDEQAAAAAVAAQHGPVSAKPYSSQQPSQPPSNLDMLDVSMTEEWYVAINGVPVGPIRVSELRRKAAGGAIHDDSLCWQEGLEEWRPVKAIPELARIVREAAMSGRPSLTNERSSQTPPPPQGGTGTLIPSSQNHGQQQAQQANAPLAPQAAQAPRAPARPATSGPMAPQAPAAAAPSPIGNPFGARPQQPSAPSHAAASGASGGSAAGGLQQTPAPSPFLPPPQQAPLAPAARNNVVPISAGRLATAERLEDPAPLLFTPPPPAVSSAPFPPVATPAPTPPPTAVADPFGVNGLAGAGAASPYGGGASANTAPGLPGQGLPVTAGIIAPATAPSLIPVQQKRGTPLWAIAAIVFAGCFGIAVAVMVFMPKPPPVQPIAVQTATAPTLPTAQPSVDPSAALAAAPSASAAPDPSAGASAKIASTGPKSSGGAVAVASPATTHTGADLKNLLGTGPGGPSDAPGPGGGTAAGGGSGLDANAVQTVVRNRQQGVRRKCWDTGSNDQKPSANVQVAVTVAPNGSVTNAVATGDEPVASCIAREVKSWSFPAPGSTTTVNIPFHFVRQ